MDPALQSLFDTARHAMSKAYAPYSHFHVGAAVRSIDGMIFSGCNTENASYPVGTCAEAGAIAAMAVHGQRMITDIAVCGSSDELCFPCGACRQRIREFSNAATKIYIGNRDFSRHAIFSVDQLLPSSFGPEMLPA